MKTETKKTEFKFNLKIAKFSNTVFVHAKVKSYRNRF